MNATANGPSLEQRFGSRLDAMTDAERDCLARYLFPRDGTAEMAKTHAPHLFRLAMLAAISTAAEDEDD